MERPYKIMPPKGIADYVLKNTVQAFLVFDRKEDRCRCTRCGAERKISRLNDRDSLIHNVRHWCYDCRTEAICKEFRYGRKNITEYGRILWLRKRGKVTFAELDEYQINYTGWEPAVFFWPSAQYRFCKETQEYYKHTPEGCWTPDRWEKRKEVKLPSPAAGMFNGWKMPKYQRTIIYKPSMSMVGSDLKYADLDMNRFHGAAGDYAYELIRYMYNFLKYPSIEILEKSGFARIVKERIDGGASKEINWRTADLRKILKLNRAEIREFRAMGRYASIYNLEKYKDIKRLGYRVPFSRLNLVSDYRAKEKIGKIEEFMKLEKALAYLESQKGELYTYLDYLQECKRLGYDLKDKKVLFPDNLQAAHEATSEKIQIQTDAKKKEDFIKSIKKLYDRPEYREDTLLIRPARDPEELAKESAALHHCVRTYVDKVARGNCVILFIRRTSEPDKPYFTLELSPEGKIVQCRGDHNRDYPQDVKEFLERWQKWMKTKKKKEAA